MLLLLLPTPMWMPNMHYRPMHGRVEVSVPSRGLFACARGGRLSVLPVLACLMYVFDLNTPLLRPALCMRVLLPFSHVFFSCSN